MLNFYKLRRVFLISLFLVLMLGFQNCSRSSFYETLNSTEEVQATNESSVTDQNDSSSLEVPKGSEVKNPTSRQTASSSTPQTTPIANNPGQAIRASIETCTDYMRNLGYEGFSVPLQVDLNPIDNMNLVGTNPYAYAGISVGFNAKAPIGEASFYRKFDMSQSGFRIKITDMASNYSIYVNNAEKSFASSRSGTGASKTINFHFSRALYTENKNSFSNVKLELYCADRLVGGGVQDFHRLEYPLAKVLQRTNYGTYTYADASYMGFINMSCPNEALTGSQVTCKASGVSISRLEWFVNNTHIPEFKDLRTVSFQNVPTGVHTVQAIAYTAEGKVMRSLINTVRISR